MRYYDFSRLINKYSKTLTAEITQEGSYDNRGIYIKPSPTQSEFTGAIINTNDFKMLSNSNTLIEYDAVLYTLSELSNSFWGAVIKNGTKSYKIMQSLENADFTGVYMYTLKSISTFNIGS